MLFFFCILLDILSFVEFINFFVSFSSWSPSFVRSDGKLRHFHPSAGSFNPRAAYMCTYMELLLHGNDIRATHTHTHTHTRSSTVSHCMCISYIYQSVTNNMYAWQYKPQRKSVSHRYSVLSSMLQPLRPFCGKSLQVLAGSTKGM